MSQQDSPASDVMSSTLSTRTSSANRVTTPSTRSSPFVASPAPREGDAASRPSVREGTTPESSSVWVNASMVERSAATETMAHRMHAAFQTTAVPTGFIIGLFLIALFFQEKVGSLFVGRVISLYCAVMTVIMTGLLIYLHLTAYTNPPQQRFIIRILLMVPIYAVDSCVAIWDHSLAPVIGLARDCYESYVIYNFFYLLMSYLGGEEQALASLEGAKVRHMPPLCCLPPFQLNAKTFRWWKIFLVQYMWIKPIFAVIAILLTPSGHYDEASWSFNNAHVYFVFIMNISVTVAFTTLVYFFMEYRTLLAVHKPVGKFAAVKSVVFLSFWQGVLMGILVHVGVIQESREGLWSSDQVSTGLQDFLICIEMLLMCYVHHRVFPETPYVPLDVGHQPIQPWVWKHALSVSDVVDVTAQTMHDVRDTIREKDEESVKGV